MINILYLNPVGYIGGAEKSLIELVENLPRDLFNPLVVSLGPGPLAGELRKKGVECREIFLPSSFLSLSRGKGKNNLLSLLTSPFLALPTIARLINLIHSRQIKVIHTNGIKAHLLGSVLSLLTGRILIWDFRDLLEKGIYLHLFRALARLFPKRIIASSLAIKERLGDLKKIKVVYNSIDHNFFLTNINLETARRELGLQPNNMVIGTISHFAPLKGYEDFIRAMPIILKKIPQAEFLIVGEAIYPAYRDYKQNILNLIDRLGLSEKVICPGYREDLPRILGALDIFVLPSWSEGFGRGNLEAMVAGKPVVSTKVGGIPEVVVDGETGFLVPPHNPEALARAIIKLAEDRHLRRKMGRAGRRKAELFSIRRTLEGDLKVYNEVLNLC